MRLDAAASKRILTPPDNPRTRLRKLECDHCGLVVRAAYGPYARARAGGGRLVCPCGAPMRLSDLADAGRLSDDDVSDDDLHEHPDWIRERKREERRAKREARGGHPPFQCGGCGRFITATNTHCRCGFANDINPRTRHNSGGWREYPGDPQERMPF